MRQAINLLIDMLLCAATREVALRELRMFLVPRVRWNVEAVPYLDMFPLVGTDSDYWYCWKHGYCMSVVGTGYSGNEEIAILAGASGKPFDGRLIPRKLLVDVPWHEYILSRYGGSDVLHV